MPLINIEKEHKQLRDELIAAKEESDKLLSNLLDSDRLRKEQEDLIDFLRRHEVHYLKLLPASICKLQKLYKIVIKKQIGDNPRDKNKNI